MAKPVNPSVPPPAVDDGGEGGQNSASASGQPGLALLGLLSVGASSSSSSSNTSAASSMPSPNGANAAQQSPGSATASGAAQEGPSGGWNGASSASSFGAEGGGSGARGEGSGRVGGGGSRLFKGFQTTETVVRRKKPPPVTTSALAAETPSASPTMYPKDIWPGHKPPSQKADGSSKGGMGVVAREEGGDGKAGADDELMEFFCDGCDVTIPNGVERMECVVCPGEFCFCQACYDAGELLDKKHEHELLPSSAPFHITSAAPNAEAAAAAAQALHVTEEARNDQGGELDGGYDDEDLG
ncbi:unnamed protein product [Ascophyllum nodosum]